LVQNIYLCNNNKKMAGRPKIFDQQTALEKASKLFWEKGYEATSLDDLISVMGIQKGSFYHSFGSKKLLFIETIKLYEKISFEEYEKLLKETENPIELIKAFFLHCADSPKSEHLKGCFAGNTLAELTGIDEELTRNAKEYLKKLENIFFEQISIAQNNKTIKNKTEPKILARYLLNLWNGINITRRIYQSNEDLKPLIEFQLSILN
jgi:TetR/AcrR family transcriptional regulator, transcriptional repressor for nem operon